MGTEPGQVRWPVHLPAGALRVARWSARYEETVTFYRDTIGLPVLETFQHSYGLDGVILGLPGGQEIGIAKHQVRSLSRSGHPDCPQLDIS